MESYALSGLRRQNRETVGSTVQGHHEHRTDRWRLVRMVYHYLRSNARLRAVATALENNEFGAKVSEVCISNLRFADGICLITEGNDFATHSGQSEHNW